MRKRYLCWSTVIFVLVSSGLGVGRSESPLVGQAPDSDEVYAQVSCVTIEPSAIHIVEKPDATTVIVQIILRGPVPPNSTARVGVGTYSTDPPGINVSYDPVQIVQLKESPTVVKFRAKVGSQTTAGKLIVAASINGATNGVKVKISENPQDWHGKLVIADP
jgi:hypothetical protein